MHNLLLGIALGAVLQAGIAYLFIMVWPANPEETS